MACLLLLITTPSLIGLLVVLTRMTLTLMAERREHERLEDRVGVLTARADAFAERHARC